MFLVYATVESTGVPTIKKLITMALFDRIFMNFMRGHGEMDDSDPHDPTQANNAMWQKLLI